MSEPTHSEAPGLHDLTVAVEGVAFEVEALNETLRQLLGVFEVGAELDPPPSWVNSNHSSERLARFPTADVEPASLRREQDAGRAVGYVVLTTFVGMLLIAALALYVIS
jgi:hypothetical protein